MDVILLTCLSGQLWQRAIGPYQLASHLRQAGLTVQVIDFTDSFTTDELYNAVNSFIGPNTRAVGVSSTFYKTELPSSNIHEASKTVRASIGFLPDNIVETIRRVKMLHPSIKTVVGGAGSTRFENDTLFDIVVHGYSEESFLEHLQHGKRVWPRLANTVINGDADNIDIEHLTHVWEDQDCVLPNETLPIEISRGCIFRCKFCAYPLNGKKKFDYLRSADVIKAELIDNYERFGTTNYFFGDDTFNDSTYKLEQLHKAITSLPFKIEFTTYLRLDLLESHREQLTLLKEMGLGSAFFGIESMNEKTAKFIGKGMRTAKVKDFLLELKTDLWKDDISMLCTFIVGLPFEDVASTDKTFEWINAQNISNVWAPLTISPTARYKSDIDINYDKYGYTFNNGMWTNDIMSQQQAIEVANRYNQITIPNYGPRSWALFALLSMRVYNRKELESIAMKDLPSQKLLAIKAQMIADYKKKLLQC